MKMIIEVNDPEQAMEMLRATSYVSFLEELWAWLRGQGREDNAGLVASKIEELALIHRICLT